MDINKTGVYIELTDNQKELLTQWLNTSGFLLRNGRSCVKSWLKDGKYDTGDERSLLIVMRRRWIKFHT